MKYEHLKDLALIATDYLLQQKPLSITHAAGWERNGFPLPIKRMTADTDGTTTQDYRPLAVLEYVNDVLSGVIASNAIKTRNSKKGEAA